MKKPPMVSIVMGCYKGEKEIGATLKHIVHEVKYPNLEVFVAVDTYEDNSINIVKNYASKYKKIKYDFSEYRRGVSRALSDVLKKVTGEIIVHFGSEFRFFNPSNDVYNIVKYFEDPLVGAIMVDGKDPEDLAEKRKRNININSQMVMSKIILDWRRQKFKHITKGHNYPTICNAFRAKLVSRLDDDVINDDAEFAYSVLDRGYRIVFADNVHFYSMGEPSSLKSIFRRQSRTTAGWFKIGSKRRLNLTKYYCSILEYFITNFYKYDIRSIMALIYVTPIYAASVLEGYKKRRSHPTNIWKIYKKFKQ